MKFSKETLIELAEDLEVEGIEGISSEQYDSLRWVVVYQNIFKFKGKLYAYYPEFGKTECQETDLFEYEPDMIECPEMESYEDTIIKYRGVK